MRKKCVKCGLEKSLVDFYKQKETKDGLRGTCKLCQYTPRPNRKREPKDAVYRHLFVSCKNSALTRKLSFELSEEQHKYLISLPCHHCGVPPQPYNHYKVDSCRRLVLAERVKLAWIYKNGIDRIDNKRGYDYNNCVPACSTCNYGRQDYTVEEYIEHCYKVTIFQQSKIKNGAA